MHRLKTIYYLHGHTILYWLEAAAVVGALLLMR
jgi:hypothetical protein